VTVKSWIRHEATFTINVDGTEVKPSNGSPEPLAQVQFAVNDVARSVVGCRREDHVTIEDLLEAANYLLLNLQVVKATAMSAWSAYNSSDGSNGTRNPVGTEMFGSVNLPTARPSRATTEGEVWVRTRGMDTHVTHGLEVWNACAALHNSKSKAKASRATCAGFTTVRRSRFGHREDASTLRDGDRPEKKFWLVSTRRVKTFSSQGHSCSE
jgi:hypothetical protein